MKTTPILAAVLRAQLLFSSAAFAYWTRGAAERALYYSVYVLEDIHTDAQDGDGYKIAGDCVGTRVGLRKQSTRCNFAEFLDQTWAETRSSWKENGVVKEGMDKKPVSGNIKWPASMTGLNTATAMWSMITSVPYTDGQKVMNRKTNPSQFGYTGNVQASKFFPQETSNYFEALDKFGPRAVQLKAEMEDKLAIGGIDKKTSDKFGKFYDSALQASTMIRDFRVKDKWEHFKKGGDWDRTLGVKTEWVTPKGPDGKDYKTTWAGSWLEIDRDATIKKMVSELNISPAEAASRFDSHLLKLESSETALSHGRAITAAENGLKAMTEGGVCKK